MACAETVHQSTVCGQQPVLPGFAPRAHYFARDYSSPLEADKVNSRLLDGSLLAAPSHVTKLPVMPIKHGKATVARAQTHGPRPNGQHARWGTSAENPKGSSGKHWPFPNTTHGVFACQPDSHGLIHCQYLSVNSIKFGD